MKLRIHHTTVFSYDEPISEGFTEVRLKPQDGQGQLCPSFALTSNPSASVFSYRDRHGNEVLHFDLLTPHDRLTVTARSVVHTADEFVRTETGLSLVDRFDFLQPTTYAPLGEAIRELAGPCVVQGDSAATVARVTAAVRGRLRYETGSTDVTTTAEDALARGAGVCQDFTHVALGACRSLGLPSRYVSGYIYAPGSASGAASHAWLDVFLDGHGWISVDPTHDTFQNGHHVRLAVGCDYADVPPTRGVFKGNAKESLGVTVKIEPL